MPQVLAQARALFGVEKWEEPFRDKIERELPGKDLLLVMGTVHRFPNQWLIIGLIYPPRVEKQPTLF